MCVKAQGGAALHVGDMFRSFQSALQRGLFINAPAVSSCAVGETARRMMLQAWFDLVSDFLAVTKARANVAVVATAFVGFALHAELEGNWLLLAHTLIGVGLLAAAAAVANQTMEREFDAKMQRTWHRPIAAGRMSARGGVLLCGGMAAGGGVWLAAAVNLHALLYAALAFGIYVFAYTPLKRRTPLCTLPGAVSGALPLLAGWAATGAEFGMWTIVSTAILFAWQAPHFMAIAWWRRAQYSDAGYRVLGANDRDGARAAICAAVGAVGAIAVSLIPAATGHASALYAVCAAANGIAFAYFAARFLGDRNESTARSLFIASLYFLPAVYAAMLFCQE